MDDYVLFVFGSRDFHVTKETITHHIKKIYDENGLPHEIVHGGARGADRDVSRVGLEMAEGKAIERVFLPDWHRYGRSAGYRRNEVMLKYLIESGKKVIGLGFYSDSKGSTHMGNLLKENGIELIKVDI